MASELRSQLMSGLGSAASAYDAASAGYDTGNWWQRNFDSGYLDIKNTAYQNALDRNFNALMQDKANAFNASEAQKSRNWQEKMTAAANAFSSEEAQKARDWEERMSNTAYSRAVKQLEELGLNPYLAVTNGMQASTPSGPAARSSGFGGATAYGVAASSHGGHSSSYSSGGKAFLSFLSGIASMGLNAYSMAARTSALSSHYANVERLREIELASRW